jgi:CheY-like chemotaxis protein/anti-sigma regulatory factor (Ser/Thr protein kinase)
MERLEAEFSTIARTKGLIFQIDGPDLIAYSDPILLETMLRNLISNAIRFTENGEVKVIWLILEKQVLISVNDSGIGIPKEDRGRIFEEFMQLNNPGRDRNIGLGLGLAIVKRLSLLLNCEVTVQSISKMGSAFQMLIPKGDAALIVNESGPLEQMIENEPGLLVLVIDDEVSIREGMKALLGNWGHEVVVAGSLAEALQTMEYPPDAILADYRLRDEKNGIAAIKVICKNWGREIPSLIITGDTAPELSSVMQASGMDFMHKPVSPAK